MKVTDFAMLLFPNALVDTPCIISHLQIIRTAGLRSGSSVERTLRMLRRGPPPLWPVRLAKNTYQGSW